MKNHQKLRLRNHINHIQNYKLSLFDVFIKKTENDEIYVRGLNREIKKLVFYFRKNNIRVWQLEEALGIKKHSINWWYDQGMPLSHLFNIKKIYNNTFKKGLPQKNIILSLRGSHHNIKIPKLNRKLAYVTGYLYGDGTLSSYKKGERLEFYDISKEYLEYTASNITNLFNIKTYSIKKDKRKECFQLRFNNKLLVLFFNKVFEVPIGKKKGKSKIPEIIKDSSYVLDFISGFFDAEGHVYYTPEYGYRISCAQCDNLFLKEISDALFKLKIANKITNYRSRIYELRISNKENFYKFLSIFKLKHPAKTSRIKLALEKKSTIKHKRN